MNEKLSMANIKENINKAGASEKRESPVTRAGSSLDMFAFVYPNIKFAKVNKKTYKNIERRDVFVSTLKVFRKNK